MGTIIDGGKWEANTAPTTVALYQHTCGCVIGLAEWTYYHMEKGKPVIDRTDTAYILVHHRHEGLTDWLTCQSHIITACPHCNGDLSKETLQVMKLVDDRSNHALTMKDTECSWGEIKKQGE